MTIERAVFLVGALTTHALVGYALVSRFTPVDPRVGALAGLFPDVDLLVPPAVGEPFVHRGVTHTPLFLVAAALAVYAARRDRPLALAVGVALGSHLLVDSLSPQGIDWLFPLSGTWTPGWPIHGPVATALLWAGSLWLLSGADGDRSLRGPR